jgi:hypothetical protein
MAINKISGNILQDNLQRGANLSFQGNLVYIDVDNTRLGVNTASTTHTLTVVGNAHISNISLEGNSISADSGILELGSNANVQITGGSANYLLTTDGTGNLSWSDIADLGLLGNLTISNTTITSNIANASITLTPTGTGLVIIDTITGLTIPTGNTAQRPTPPVTGTMRFNTGTNLVEIYDGADWVNVGSDVAAISDQTITGDGSTVTFVLDQDTTAASIIVSTNGVVQKPATAYTVTGNSITFAEAPLSSDIIDVRFISNVQTLNELSNGLGNAITVLDNGVGDMSTLQSAQLPSYTVTQANALGNVANGQVIYCSNGDSGGPCLAVYSVNAWKIVSLGGNITV